MNIENRLQEIERQGNLRSIPAQSPCDVVDFSTNDYLGLAARTDLVSAFLREESEREARLSSSASRLLSSHQADYAQLEQMLGSLYGREVLLFNSGYHANTGIVSAIADSGTLIVADRLVHASIIDGIILSRAPFVRFRHNDWAHLEKIISENASRHERILLIVESVYSMDGDMADIQRLADLKHRFPNVMLYVDEAHAFGAMGSRGLGLTMDCDDARSKVDIIVGTFGKAGASVGAFAAVSATLRTFLLNTARSFIFSTALPPLNVRWTSWILRQIVGMDEERRRLATLSQKLQSLINPDSSAPATHIQPVIVGSAERAVEMSHRLLHQGLKVLPIRYPTVARGTERLRISLSASMTEGDVVRLANAINSLKCNS